MRKTIGMAIVAIMMMTSVSAQELKTGQINLDCKMDVTLKGGYTHSMIFVLNGEKFLFSHNSSSGQTDIWNMEKGGNPVYSKKWSSGWTNIDFYEYRDQVYCFHQKGGEGTAKIALLKYDNIMKNESLGEIVYDKKWSEGWTTTKFFVHERFFYFLHYKAEDGLCRLNGSAYGSDIGVKIYEKNWAKGYTNFAMTTLGDNFFILYQKEDEGTCVINKIDLNKLETALTKSMLTPNLGEETYRKKWSTGWSNTEFFTLNNEVYLFFNKTKEGTARIEKLNADGTLGERVYDKTWSEGWSAIDIFYIDGKPYLMHQKKSTGQTKICELKF